MKVQKIKLSPYDYSWIVLNNNHLPIKPITELIKYLNNIDKSPFTVRSYAYHLKLYWEFLDAKKLDRTQIKLSGLAAFVGWLGFTAYISYIIKFFKLLELIEKHGANLGPPHTEAMGDGLFEIRAKAQEGIARSLYVI